MAIWDNRSTWHTGYGKILLRTCIIHCRLNIVPNCHLFFQTNRVPDFKPYSRRGVRVTVSGEKPYFDKENSTTQAQAWEVTAKAITAKQEAAAAEAQKLEADVTAKEA